MPKVSFIIPFCNLPIALLLECIDSILALSLEADEREIIVVDDGSKTSPKEALVPYSHHIIYIQQKNSGLSAARNTGIERATGDYIQFVDADDTLIPQAYNAVFALLKEHHPDILLFGFTESVSQTTPVPSFLALQATKGRAEKGGKYEMSSTPYSFGKEKKHQASDRSPSLWEGRGGFDYLRRRNLRASAWGYAFRRSILGDLRFTPGLLHEDEEFTPLLFLRANTVMESRLTAYYYRQREQSIVHTVDAQHLRKRLDDTERILFHLHDVATTLPTKALDRRVAQLTMDYLYNTMKLRPDELTERVERLRQSCLYPLPVRNYTMKYKCFACLASTRLGLKILAAVL